jgi:hypothetical protein
MDRSAPSCDYSRFVLNLSTPAGLVAGGFSGMLAHQHRINTETENAT